MKTNTREKTVIIIIIDIITHFGDLVQERLFVSITLLHVDSFFQFSQFLCLVNIATIIFLEDKANN